MIPLVVPGWQVVYPCQCNLPWDHEYFGLEQFQNFGQASLFFLPLHHSNLDIFSLYLEKFENSRLNLIFYEINEIWAQSISGIFWKWIKIVFCTRLFDKIKFYLLNSCVVFFSPNSCVADWQFFAKVPLTGNWYTVPWNWKLSWFLQTRKNHSYDQKWSFPAHFRSNFR